MGISYDTIKSKSYVATTFAILNALGAIMFSFRGHNLVLEIQVQTLPILFVCVYALMIKITCQINLRRLVFNSLSVRTTIPYIMHMYPTFEKGNLDHGVTEPSSSYGWIRLSS